MNIKRPFRRTVFRAALALLGAGALLALAAPARAWYRTDMTDQFGNDYQTLMSGSNSTRIKVTLVDDYWTAVNSTTPVVYTMEMFNQNNSGVQVPFRISFNNGSTFSSVSGQTTVTIASGASVSSEFIINFDGFSAGEYALRVSSYPFFDQYYGGESSYYFSVLGTGQGAFTNVSLRTDSQAAGSGQTQVTITPNRDGANDAAVIHARPPSDGPWEMFISDLSFNDLSAYNPPHLVKQFWGYGEHDMFWYAEDFNWRTVPAGTYYVRLQTPGGGIVYDGLQVIVESVEIKGVVRANGEPVADVDVNAWGMGGGGYSRTDSNGRFSVGGLTPGQTYTVNFSKPGLASLQRQGIQAPADMGNVDMSQGAVLRVRVNVDKAPLYDLWGGVNVNNSNYTSSAWGGLHIASGATTSDNGFPVADPSYRTYTDIGVLPDTDYRINVDIPEFGHLDRTVRSPASGATKDDSETTFTFTRKAVVYGRITLPQPVNTPYGGEWISVDATKSGNSYPTAWGGVFIPKDDVTTTGIYSLPGLDQGQYTFRTWARGYKSESLSVNVTGDMGDPTTGGGADFPALSEGGKITGTVRVIGDTSGTQGDNNFFSGGSGCGAGQFPVFLNAWSPSNFNGSFAQVCLNKDGTESSASYEMKGLDDGTYEFYTFLSGFQLEPPGPKRVTLSGGSASLDITFRALSGTIELSASLPAGDNPALVSYNVGGGGFESQQKSGTLDANGRASVTGLGTGLYRVTLINNNPGRGLQKTAATAVTNGRTTSLSMDLNETTYNLSGTVSIQGSLSVPSVLASSQTVNVSSVTGLQTAAPGHPLVQVFAFPLPEHFYGDVQPLRSAQVTPSGTAATFSLSGFLPGTYLVRVKEDLNPNQSSNNNCPDCPAEPGQPEFGTTNELVFIKDANVSDVDLTLTNGVKLSGAISRPTGDTSTDQRSFFLRVRRSDNLAVWQSSVTSTSASTNYSFTHLAPGDYILEVYEGTDSPSTIPKYVAAPKRVTIGNSDVTQNITLLQAGTIVGKMRDADSNTLLTSRNVTQFLPNNFGIFAKANPWVPGGWAQAQWSNTGPGPYISSATNQFAIYRVVPDTSYDVIFRGFTGLDAQAMARGQKAYAPVTKSGVRVAPGQIVDVGVIDLNQGVSLSGHITDTQGNSLPNIRVQALPSLSQGEDRWEMSVEGYTDADGKYTLQGVDDSQRFYDVVAAPRFKGGDVFAQLGGTKYGAETLEMVDVTDPAKRVDVDFQLTEANAVLTGKVQTVDGGPLSLPFGGEDGKGGGGEFAERRAAVFLHEEGATLGDNPLGEIEEVTDALGNFRIDALKPGTYTMRIVSVGYVTAKKTLQISAGSNSAGTITLEKGATVSGTITKPDGTNPGTDEVDMVVGVDEDFEEFVFGRVDSNSGTNLVTGYELTGFKTGVNYSIIIVTGDDDLLEAKSDLTFSSASEEKTVNLVYRPAPPAVYAIQSRSGNTFTLRFFSTQKLRNLTDTDNDLPQIIQLVEGNGTIISRDLSPSRDLITVVYQAAANEKTFKIRLAFTSIQVDLDSPTGDNFTFKQDFKFFAGAARMRVVRVPNATGGSAKLEGDPTGGAFLSGAFDVNRSSRVEIGVVSAALLDDLSTAAAPAAGPRARAQGAQAVAQRLGPEAYPSPGMYRAVQAAPSVSPFSAFYDIFLPAGVSHTLKKEALLTLKYDSTVTDPSALNVYYFDPNNNVFLLEANKRKIDAKNKTITVAVNHASTFVVLSNNAPIVGSNTYTGTEIAIHNFPNPFHLKSKTVTLNNAPAGSTSQTIEGTMIRYALPSGKSGAVQFEIYNVAGEKVRTITESAAAGGTYYYTQWDGKNDGGKKVASGVYIARFTLNGGDERFFKMAVLK